MIIAASGWWTAKQSWRKSFNRFLRLRGDVQSLPSGSPTQSEKTRSWNDEEMARYWVQQTITPQLHSLPHPA